MKLKQYLNETKGSFLDNKRIPKQGQAVYALVGFERKVVKGTVTKLSNIDQKGLANTYLDINAKGKNYHVDISQVYDHKPKQVKTKDEYGEVTIWEATLNLNKDVKEFISKNEFYKYYKTPEDFQGTCDGVSSDLYKFLLDKGYDVELIEGMGTKFDLPENHPNVNIPQYVTHVVLKTQNKVVDLTGMQFGFDKVRIIPFSQFKKQFKKIKPFEAWKR